MITLWPQVFTQQGLVKMMPNEQEEMISLTEFANKKGIDAKKVIEMIHDGFYAGRKVGDDWLVSRSELHSESTDKQEQVTSRAKKLTIIELIVLFFYILFVFNVEFGVFYLLFSPIFPLVFTIAFLITGFIFERKSNIWKGMSVLNLFLFILLSSVFWFGNAFSNFR